MNKNFGNAGCLPKQIHQCLSRLHSFSDGQVQMVRMDWDNWQDLVLEVQPNSGPFVGGRFTFVITFDEGYPTYRPVLTCKTPIYHPNIDPESDCDNVCVSLLDDWTASNTLEDLVMALLFLMHHPNVDDPVAGVDDRLFQENTELIYREKLEPINDEGFFSESIQWNEATAWELSAEEYQVLGEAAKAEWLLELEREDIKDVMNKWEVKEEKERQLDDYSCVRQEVDIERQLTETSGNDLQQQCTQDKENTEYSRLHSLAKQETVIIDTNSSQTQCCCKPRLQKFYTVFGYDSNSFLQRKLCPNIEGVSGRDETVAIIERGEMDMDYEDSPVVEECVTSESNCLPQKSMNTLSQDNSFCASGSHSNYLSFIAIKRGFTL